MIACWVRLEEAAAAAGVPRLRRGHPDRPGQPAAARRPGGRRPGHRQRRRAGRVRRTSTGEARYATHTVDERMRDQARAALRRLRGELASRCAGRRWCRERPASTTCWRSRRNRRRRRGRRADRRPARSGWLVRCRSLVSRRRSSRSSCAALRAVGLAASSLLDHRAPACSPLLAVRRVTAALARHRRRPGRCRAPAGERAGHLELERAGTRCAPRSTGWERPLDWCRARPRAVHRADPAPRLGELVDERLRQRHGVTRAVRPGPRPRPAG